MIRALWFLFKITVFVAFMVWVAELPGSIKLDLQDYVVTMEIGFFLMAVGVIVLIAIFLYNLVMAVVKFPASYKRYRDIRNREKGYHALTLGLTAVAAGDTAVASKQAELATRYLKHDTGLPLLLKAQAARMRGQEEEALKSFAILLENKDAAFLGVRGLLQAALDHNYHDKALDLAKQALKLHPKQPWILGLVYDLEIKEQLWDDALETLKRAQKLKSMDKEKLQRDFTAIYIAKAEQAEKQGKDEEALRLLENAFKHHPGFIPAALRLSEKYIQMDMPKKAMKILEQSWKKDPHPQIAKLWRTLTPQKKIKEPMERMKWFTRLHKINTKSARSFLEAGHVAMLEGLWGEARSYLESAEKIRPSKELYQMLADLERMSGKGEDTAKRWIDMAETAEPTRAWVCRDTGRFYNEWHVIAQPHGSFNSIEWTAPELIDIAAPSLHNHIKKAVIESP